MDSDERAEIAGVTGGGGVKFENRNENILARLSQPYPLAMRKFFLNLDASTPNIY